MILVANVPAKLLVSKLRSPLEMLLLLGMMVVCFALSQIGWKFSLKHYTSASA